jgi:hypothetical protein
MGDINVGARRRVRSQWRHVLLGAIAASTAAMAAVVPVQTVRAEPPDTGSTQEPLVVNGSLVSQDGYLAEWAFTVYVEIDTGDGFASCTGSLIAPTVVVTAAHCIAGGWNAIVVGSGNSDLAAHEWVVADSTYVHPFYQDFNGSPYDIALIRLSGPFSTSTPIALADAAIGAGEWSEAAGWGCNFFDAAEYGCELPGSFDDYLRETALPVTTDCPSAIDPLLQICAGSWSPTGEATQPDTCSGDSGGPLVARTAGGPRLVGLTSYGYGCGIAPGIFTAIHSLRPWIEPIVSAWTSGTDPPVDHATNVGTSEGTYVPIAPRRLTDTRTSGIVAGGSTARVDLGDEARNSWQAMAVALNVTAVDAAEPGYLTVYPCDQPIPNASNVNFQPGTNVAGSVYVGIDASSQVCIYTSATTHLLVDIGGYFQGVAGTGGSRYHSLPAQRIIDTRPAGFAPGQISQLSVGAFLAGDTDGEAPRAVTLNVAAVDPAGPGYVSVFPCGALPNVSNVNFAWENVANAVTVTLDGNGDVCLYSSTELDLIVDVTGWFGADGSPFGDRFVPSAPTRIADTRTWDAPIFAGEALIAYPTDSIDAPGNTGAVAVNVTAVGPAGPGFLTTFPCDIELPGASTVNYSPGRDVPNLATIPIAGDGSICVYSNETVDILVDTFGYFVY